MPLLYPWTTESGKVESPFKQVLSLGEFHTTLLEEDKKGGVSYIFCVPAMSWVLSDILVSFHFHKNVFPFAINEHKHSKRFHSQEVLQLGFKPQHFWL